jgi:hypothetical protein
MRSALANLPKDSRGRPIPWFVTETNEKGEPDFVHINPRRPLDAYVRGLCWICGGPMAEGKRTFVLGPMSLFSRICTEPPMHLDCARFSVQTCPFMLNPKRKRIETDTTVDGTPLDRNPGVTLVYMAKRFAVETRNNIVYHLGPHQKLEAWKEGRRATLYEFTQSVETGIEELRTKVRPGQEEEFQSWIDAHVHDVNILGVSATS